MKQQTQIIFITLAQKDFRVNNYNIVLEQYFS